MEGNNILTGSARWGRNSIESRNWIPREARTTFGLGEGREIFGPSVGASPGET
jgi:hypothetical protein